MVALQRHPVPTGSPKLSQKQNHTDTSSVFGSRFGSIEVHDKNVHHLQGFAVVMPYLSINANDFGNQLQDVIPGTWINFRQNPCSTEKFIRVSGITS